MGGFKFTGKARREPNADIRQVGVTLHEFYTGCVGAGFDKNQAQARVERAPKVIHLDHPDGAICGGTGWTTRIQENVSCDVCRRLIEELKL